MKHIRNNTWRAILTVACLLPALILTSCDDGTYDHVPPAGQGSIIIENNSGEDTQVYIDGILFGTVRERKTRIFDMTPRTYRIVLDEDDGYRSYRDDIDVLADRLTVMDVMIDYSSSSLYHVILDFQ